MRDETRGSTRRKISCHTSFTVSPFEACPEKACRRGILTAECKINPMKEDATDGSAKASFVCETLLWLPNLWVFLGTVHLQRAYRLKCRQCHRIWTLSPLEATLRMRVTKARKSTSLTRQGRMTMWSRLREATAAVTSSVSRSFDPVQRQVLWIEINLFCTWRNLVCLCMVQKHMGKFGAFFDRLKWHMSR